MERVVSGPQVAALAALAATPIAGRFYLAGGTALALHLGHRESVDLDLFREEPFDPTAELAHLRGSSWSVTSSGDSMLHLLYRHAPASPVRVSLLGYPYPLLRPLVPGAARLDSRIRLASVEDILAMKVSAIGRRGSRRDFVDLYCAMKNRSLDLAAALALFDEKYRGVRYDRYHFVRALTYFADADREPMPRMRISLEWDEVKRHFESQACAMVTDA